MGARRHIPVWLVVIAVTTACEAQRPGSLPGLSPSEQVAPGIEFYSSTDQSLVGNVGPIALYLLRVDPSRVRLASALSNDTVMDAEPVDAMARRLGAVAAINGGFFNRTNGEPVGLLKVAGRLVSDAGSLKGAVVIERPSDQRPMALTFDRLAARVRMKFVAEGREWTVPINGVDTTRQRGRLMLYTPAYHYDTDTAPTGTEWLIDGTPPRVRDVRMNFGHTVIPKNGAVLSFGGTTLPDPLPLLVEGVTVTFETAWTSEAGLAGERLNAATDVVNGAGLLRRQGQIISDWTPEGLNEEVFVNARHPRTLIGMDEEGFVWLAAVDGRQADYSIGMTFVDLQRLAHRLKLRDALNLDGGGSTTMVVNGRVVNRPSDFVGPRPVSDAIIALVQ